MNFIGIPRQYLRKLYPPSPIGPGLQAAFWKLGSLYLEGYFCCHGESMGDDGLFLCGPSLPAVQLHAAASRQEHLAVHLYRGVPSQLASCKTNPRILWVKESMGCGLHQKLFWEQSTGVAQVASGLPSVGWEEKRGLERVERSGERCCNSKWHIRIICSLGASDRPLQPTVSPEKKNQLSGITIL